jgi:hypothetical protein
MKHLLAVLFFAAALLPARAAGDRIWSALVLATKENPPQPVPEKLTQFAPTIKKVFGYNSLYLLGEKKRDLVSGGETWLIPSQDFFVKVQCLEQRPTCYRLRVELFRDKDLLVSGDVKLARDAPLYIRGPEWGKGQLIFLLEVQ